MGSPHHPLDIPSGVVCFHQSHSMTRKRREAAGDQTCQLMSSPIQPRDHACHTFTACTVVKAANAFSAKQLSVQGTSHKHRRHGQCGRFAGSSSPVFRVMLDERGQQRSESHFWCSLLMTISGLLLQESALLSSNTSPVLKREFDASVCLFVNRSQLGLRGSTPVAWQASGVVVRINTWLSSSYTSVELRRTAVPGKM